MRTRYVNGYTIRQTLDVDFTLIHQRGDNPIAYKNKDYIPAGEIWIDDRFRSETEFLLETEEAYQKFTDDEKKQYREVLKKIFCKSGPPPPFVIDRKRRLDHTLISVNGEIIRQYFDPEFAFGGHHFVYDYVPKREIWLDHLMDPLDIPHLFLHEIEERRLMGKKKMTYDIAHEYASIAERISRRRSGGMYPGDENYPRWLTYKEWLKQYYVDRKHKSTESQGARAGKTAHK